MDRFRISVMFLSLLFSFDILTAQTSTDVINFFTSSSSPFTSYNKRIRPKLNQEEVLSVSLNFGLTAISGLDEIGGTLYLVGCLEATWEDELVNWTASDFGNLETIMLTQSDVWTPSLTLHTSVRSLSELGESASPVEVSNNGTIQWKPGLVIETGCSVDVSYYPFDIQSCDVTFIPWQHTADMVQLYPKETTVDTSIMQLSSEWDLTQTSVENKTGVYSEVTYQLTLKRRPQFFVLNMILPIILIGLLNGFVFVMPFEQGRVGFIITGFLSIGIFLTIVSDILPKSSNPMSLLGYFLIWQLMLGALCTLEAILTLKIYFREGKIDLPGSLKKFLTIVWFYPCRGKSLHGKKDKKDTKSPKDSDEEKTDSEAPENGEEAQSTSVSEDKTNTKTGDENGNTDEKIETDDGNETEKETGPKDEENEDENDEKKVKKGKSKKEEEQEIEATWVTLGGTLDVMFFVLFVILSFIIFMMFLLPLITNA